MLKSARRLKKQPNGARILKTTTPVMLMRMLRTKRCHISLHLFKRGINAGPSPKEGNKNLYLRERMSIEGEEDILT